MFMFQNGLLISFIPEILMVIGYVLCLLTPAVKPQETQIDACALVMQVSAIEHSTVSSYQTSYHDFQAQAELVEASKPELPLFVPQEIRINYKSTFSTTDGLSYVDFTRPPPGFIS